MNIYLNVTWTSDAPQRAKYLHSLVTYQRPLKPRLLLSMRRCTFSDYCILHSDIIKHRLHVCNVPGAGRGRRWWGRGWTGWRRRRGPWQCRQPGSWPVMTEPRMGAAGGWVQYTVQYTTVQCSTAARGMPIGRVPPHHPTLVHWPAVALYICTVHMEGWW